MKNAPISELSRTWRYESAQLHYALLFYSAFWIYLCIISKYVLNIRYMRSIIYPFCFIVIFFAFHGVAMIWGRVVLWGMVVSIPLGLVALGFVFFISLKKDIQDKLSPLQKKNDEFERKSLYIITLFLVPVLLISFTFYALKDEISEQPENKIESPSPREKTEVVSAPEVPLTAGCEYLSGLLKTAAGNVKIASSDTLKKVAETYQSEFQKKEVYGKIELHQLKADSAEFYLYKNLYTRQDRLLHIFLQASVLYVYLTLLPNHKI